MLFSVSQPVLDDDLDDSEGNRQRKMDGSARGAAGDRLCRHFRGGTGDRYSS
jgi:hypothetical protein